MSEGAAIAESIVANACHGLRDLDAPRSLIFQATKRFLAALLGDIIY